ncbi:MAG: hypothetical protein HKN82_19075 [Akkermansiaceae bacterium]|nr:hypothetical protein [Akkermansiaceae bacterium]
MPASRLTLALLAVALCGPAQAGITYSGVQDIAIPADFDGIYLDFTDPSDATQFTTSTTASAGWDINFFFGGAAIGTSDTFLPVTDAAATNADVVNVGPQFSQSIDGTGNYPSGFSGSTGHMTAVGGSFTSGVEGYIGFRLNPSSENYNGWMRVTLKDDGTTGIIHDWAWDSMGGSILVGLIPEPGAAGVAGFLLLTCALFQRRRRAASRPGPVVSFDSP